MTKMHATVAMFVVLLLAIGGNTYIALHVNDRQAQDERKTCEVQGRGLRGQKHLTAAMKDIGVLLTPVPGMHSTVPGRLVGPLGDLRQQLGAYVAIESEQPSTRSC